MSLCAAAKSADTPFAAFPFNNTATAEIGELQLQIR